MFIKACGTIKVSFHRSKAAKNVQNAPFRFGSGRSADGCTDLPERQFFLIKVRSPVLKSNVKRIVILVSLKAPYHLMLHNSLISTSPKKSTKVVTVLLIQASSLKASPALSEQNYLKSQSKSKMAPGTLACRAPLRVHVS